MSARRRVLGGSVVAGSALGFSHSASVAVPFGPAVRVEYTNERKAVDRWFATEFGGQTILGFDTETTAQFPGRRVGSDAGLPATLQLATEASALVVHLSQWEDREWPASLVEVLADPTVLKAGVGIEDDVLELYRAFPKFRVAGRVDLGGFGAPDRSRRISLRDLTAAVFGFDAETWPKSKKISTSNWSKGFLSPVQIEYAARDAWAGGAVLHELRRHPGPTTEAFAASLCAVLAAERSIEDLDDRSKRRKQAKKDLKVALDDLRITTTTTEDSEDNAATTDSLIMVTSLKKRVADLRKTIKTNCATPLLHFNLGDLLLNQPPTAANADP